MEMATHPLPQGGIFMFYTIYTIYPASNVMKRRTTRRVEPISRVKASGRIGSDRTIRNGITDPRQQVYELPKVMYDQKCGRDNDDEFYCSQMEWKRSDQARPIGELNIQSMLPLFLTWRCPKDVVVSNFIERRHDSLRVIQGKRRIHIERQHATASKERGINMTVIKKSGKKEDFLVEKWSNSIETANIKTDEPLEISKLKTDFLQIVRGKRLITTQQIDIITYGLLYSNGHMKTLIQYISYDKK